MNAAERINLVVKELKMKKKDFAAALGIHSHYFSAVCTGKRPLTEKNARFIEEKYGISAKWLLTGEGGMYAPVREMTLSEKREDLIKRLEGKSDEQIMAVLNFLDALEAADRAKAARNDGEDK